MKELTPGMKGFENRIIRYYKFCVGGVDIITQFRNLFIMLFGGYFLFKLNNPWILVLSFVVSILAFTILGWYRTFRMDKAIEWLNMKFSTVYGIKNFNYQEENNQLLKEIRDLLRDKK